MTSRLLSFLLWAAVAASGAFWGMRLFVRPGQTPPGTVVVAPGAPAAGDLTRLFGAPPAPAVEEPAAPPPAASRFKLLGVVAPHGPSAAGLALIAVDGRAAKPVALGAAVDGEWRLKSIGHRRVELAARDGAGTVVLELPALAEAARGSLPVAALGDIPVAAPLSAPPARMAPRPPALSRPMPSAVPGPSPAAPALDGQAPASVAPPQRQNPGATAQ